MNVAHADIDLHAGTATSSSACAGAGAVRYADRGQRVFTDEPGYGYYIQRPGNTDADAGTMRFFTIVPALALTALAPMVLALPAHAQALDLGGAPGAPPVPIQITASQGIQWQQGSQEVDRHRQCEGGARCGDRDGRPVDRALPQESRRAIRPPLPRLPPTHPSDPLDQGSTEIYELDAIGHVHIYTATDNAWGDHAVYSLDSDVLVLTGQHLKLTTPHDVITAKDAIEYYSREAQGGGARRCADRRR